MDVAQMALGVTFDLLPRPLHWPGGGPPVLFSQLMRWRTQVEWRAQSFIVWKIVDCVEVDLLHPHKKWVVLTSLCAFWCWPGCGIVCGLSVVGRNFLENGPPWGTGWCSCGRVLAPPFRTSFRYIKCTLTALAATPLQRTWLNGYLLPHGCLQGHLCSTHLVSVAPLKACSIVLYFYVSGAHEGLRIDPCHLHDSEYESSLSGLLENISDKCMASRGGIFSRHINTECKIPCKV